ncbi:MAG TPA: UvrB/UvrC motif-containing protein [Gemmatimonadaceae bacterium]|nr:UvrB/UvrC motif-containing protein [Gemmatimonadaceae bacterium]
MTRRRHPPAPPTTDEQLALMRATVRAGCGDRPGIYRMLSADGEVLYVGKSKRVRTRLLSYFRYVYPEDKGARIVREAATIDWEYTPSEFAALLHELRLIKRYRPRFNHAMMRDAQHYAFIKVTRGPAPKLIVVRGSGSEDGGVYYGPYYGAQRIGEAVRELNDVLGLRDCSLDQKMRFADQRELFVLPARTPGCIRHEIHKCLGPCVGGCTVAEYDERLALARLFLEGTDSGPLDSLRRQMEECSERLEFERAASFRDKLHRLETLHEQLARLRFAVETLSFLYTVPGHDGDDRVYVIRRGRVRAERAAPRGVRERNALQRMAAEVFEPVERDTAAVPTHEIDELLLLSSWFRRFPDELARTAPPQLPARSRSA